MPEIPTAFFTTQRLLFRPFEWTDLDALAAINADPEVSQWVGDGEPVDRATSALWIERSRQNIERYGSGTGAVVERATGRLIGWAGIGRPEDQPPELIYGFAKRFWRKGFGSELVPALVAWALPHIGPSLIATVDMRNAGSIKLLERAGFRLEERVVEPQGWITGVFRRPPDQGADSG